MIFNMGKPLSNGGLPVYDYTGTSEFYSAGSDWLLVLTTGGNLTFSKLSTPVDIFMVGGGGSGSSHTSANGGGGGGGGYITNNTSGVTPAIGTSYTAVIGSGGAVKSSGAGDSGGQTSIMGLVANGCAAASSSTLASGSVGGTTGGDGGTSSHGAGYGSDGSYPFGLTAAQAQILDTLMQCNRCNYRYGASGGGCAYRATSSTNFSYEGGVGGTTGGGHGAGGSGDYKRTGGSAPANSGSGGGGGQYRSTTSQRAPSGAGGSGIIILRNHQA